MSYLYDCLTRYGDVYALKQYLDPYKLGEDLAVFDDSWVQYNPRKNIPREGLSITSLDGLLTGIPDLDSIKEFNEKNGLSLDELDFREKTLVWDIVKSALEPYEQFLGRTHIIRMPVGGCFPTHRDQYSRELNSFRLFLPLHNCNPPFTYFILDNKIVQFEHGQLYFLNTCKEHTVFTTIEQSMFIVANVELTEQSVDTVLSNLFVT